MKGMVMKVWKLLGLAVLCLALVSLIGCSKSEKEPSTETQTEPEAMQMVVTDYTPTAGDIGTEVSCAVDGMKMAVAEDTPAAKYGDKVYYFCNNEEKAEFKADPEKYITPTTEPMEGMGDESSGH
jgi:YHS domain-containing protein